MKFKKIVPLCASLLMLAACSTGGSSVAPSTPSQDLSSESSEEVIIAGYELKEDKKLTSEASYDIKNSIKFGKVTSVDGLVFSSANESIATVNAQGVITRVNYGSTQITIKVKGEESKIYKWNTFTINFLPPESAMLGKYDTYMAEVEGHTDEQVFVSIEIKAENKFAINYSTGYLLAGETTYHIESAIAAEGTYEYDSMIRFTITTESFPYRKTFGGQFIFDGDNTTIKSRVPVSTEKTSNMTYFEKATA